MQNIFENKEHKSVNKKPNPLYHIRIIYILVHSILVCLVGAITLALKFTAVDECGRGTHNCDRNAICTETS